MLVGGGSSVLVVASDGYEPHSRAESSSGEINMYDPATGEPITSISGSLRVIVAYAKGGSAIGSGEGPLRIAFVSPEKDQVTDSDKWVKHVVANQGQLTRAAPPKDRSHRLGYAIERKERR